jgi:hypothetical protein
MGPGPSSLGGGITLDVENTTSNGTSSRLDFFWLKMPVTSRVDTCYFQLFSLKTILVAEPRCSTSMFNIEVSDVFLANDIHQ